MSVSGPLMPGFFGKIPARGDFLSRRVPRGVASKWETWLAMLAAAAAPRDQAEAWLTAPLWHFVLGSSLAPPHGAAGVLVASSDRVGRLFPFTIIGACDPARAGDYVTLSQWQQSVEMLVLEALAEAFDPASLDTALSLLGSPPLVTGSNQPVGVEALLDADDRPAAVTLPGPDQSAWWSRGSSRVPPTQFRCLGLPDRETATAMILGGPEVAP